MKATKRAKRTIQKVARAKYNGDIDPGEVVMACHRARVEETRHGKTIVEVLVEPLFEEVRDLLGIKRCPECADEGMHRDHDYCWFCEGWDYVTSAQARKHRRLKEAS